MTQDTTPGALRSDGCTELFVSPRSAVPRRAPIEHEVTLTNGTDKWLRKNLRSHLSELSRDGEI